MEKKGWVGLRIIVILSAVLLGYFGINILINAFTIYKLAIRTKEFVILGGVFGISILGISSFICVIGILLYKNWSRIWFISLLSVFLFWITVIPILMNYIFPRVFSLLNIKIVEPGRFIEIVLFILLLYYFTRPKIKEQFK